MHILTIVRVKRLPASNTPHNPLLIEGILISPLKRGAGVCVFQGEKHLPNAKRTTSSSLIFFNKLNYYRIFIEANS